MLFWKKFAKNWDINLHYSRYIHKFIMIREGKYYLEALKKGCNREGDRSNGLAFWQKSQLLGMKLGQFQILENFSIFEKSWFLDIKSSINGCDSLKYLKQCQKLPKYPLISPMPQIFEKSQHPRHPSPCFTTGSYSSGHRSIDVAYFAIIDTHLNL